MTTPRPRLATMLLTALGLPTLLATAAEPAAPAAQSALQGCASIAADAERLACYDRLAGRLQSAPASAAKASGAATAIPAAEPAAPPTESFGLYAPEHPKRPPVAASLEARVVAVGITASGRMTVALEGRGVWELDESDPLLGVGETVTIGRAALGSYIMHTATQRTHRVRRLH